MRHGATWYPPRRWDGVPIGGMVPTLSLAPGRYETIDNFVVEELSPWWDNDDAKEV